MSPIIPITAGLSLFGFTTWLFNRSEEPELEIVSEPTVDFDLSNLERVPRKDRQLLECADINLKIKYFNTYLHMFHVLTDNDLYRDLSDLRIFRQTELTLEDFKRDAAKPIAVTYPCLKYDIYKLPDMYYEKVTLAAPTGAGPVYFQMWMYRKIYGATYHIDRLRLTVPDELEVVCPFYNWTDEEFTSDNLIKFVRWIKEADIMLEIMNS